MPPYPAYRPSGVEWLGDVPEHWDVGRLGDVADLVNGFPFDSEVFDPEEGIPLVRIRDLFTLETEVKWAGDPVPQAEIGDRDILVGMDGDFNVAWWKQGAALLNQRLCCVRALPSAAEQRFVFYYLPFPLKALNDVTYATTVKHLSSLDVLKFRLPLPPLNEQRAIAAFLDRETERIDALVAKKRQLVERLQEYRTALITRTVTRGLPPDAARAAGLDPSPRLKPSGVEWLGEVPEHWEVVENRRLFTERDERSDDGEGELLTVSHITGVTRRSEKPDVGMFMAETLEGYKACYSGDLIINTMWAWMGATGTAREEGLVSPSYNVYTPDAGRLLPRFVDLAYRSKRYIVGMTSESRGIWTSRLRLYPQQFRSLVTAVPPIEEQQAIISHVDQIESDSLRIIETVAAAVERLREYRTALITAAVTGKIDVREAATPAAAPAE